MPFLKAITVAMLCIYVYGVNADGPAANRKILIYLPVTGHSHLKFMGSIANILQNEGYNVTLLMTILDETMNINIPMIRNIRNRITVRLDEEGRQAVEEFGGRESRKRAWSMDQGIFGFIKISQKVSNVLECNCKNIFHNSALIRDLRQRNFDIAISEPLFICGFALFDHLQIRETISIDSHTGLEGPKIAHGSAVTTSFLPATFSSGKECMSIYERAFNIVESYFNYHFASNIYNSELNSIRDVYTNGKDWKTLFRQTALVFVNSNALVDFPSPRTAKFVEIGGITGDFEGLTSVSDYDMEFYERVLTQRRFNVLISFGTNAKSVDMPRKMKEALIRTFESFPDVTFIWKYENTSVDIVKQFNPKIENVILTEWMPQTALLGNPRLDLFITHGGLGSTNEVVSSGKPVVMVPIFGDQTRNARMLERHGMAVLLKKRDLLDSESIRNAIQIVLNNKSYSENAQKLARMIRDQPYSPKDVFLKYFNFVARHGKPNGIDSNAVNLSIIAYYHLDIFLTIPAVFATVFWTARKLLRLKFVKVKVQ